MSCQSSSHLASSNNRDGKAISNWISKRCFSVMSPQVTEIIKKIPIIITDLSSHEKQVTRRGICIPGRRSRE